MTDTYTALSGRTVHIEGENIDVSSPWSGSVRFLLGKVESGFQCGPKEFATDAISLVTPFSFSEEYAHQGGRLRIGSVAVEDEYGVELRGRRGADALWMAAWEGTRLSLTSVARLPHGIRPDLAARFEIFGLAEQPEGIVLTPRKGIELYGAEVTKEVPHVGLLNTMHAPEARALVPAWGGTHVEGGELFLSGDRRFFLLANDTAVTVIQPLDDDAIDDPERMQRLESLKVSWS